MYRKDQNVTIDKADNGYVVMWRDERKQSSAMSMPDTSPPINGTSIFKTLKEALKFAEGILL